MNLKGLNDYTPKVPSITYWLKLKYFKIEEWNKKSNKKYDVEIVICFTFKMYKITHLIRVKHFIL